MSPLLRNARFTPRKGSIELFFHILPYPYALSKLWQLPTSPLVYAPRGCPRSEQTTVRVPVEASFVSGPLKSLACTCFLITHIPTRSLFSGSIYLKPPFIDTAQILSKKASLWNSFYVLLTISLRSLKAMAASNEPPRLRAARLPSIRADDSSGSRCGFFRFWSLEISCLLTEKYKRHFGNCVRRWFI